MSGAVTVRIPHLRVEYDVSFVPDAGAWRATSVARISLRRNGTLWSAAGGAPPGPLSQFLISRARPKLPAVRP